MPLYQKYRPTTFDEVVGNEVVVDSLRNLTASDKPPHAYLLTGPSGCGKTTLGRIIATSLGIDDFDYHEIDSADFRGIDSVREIRRHSGYKALRGERRAWLLDECHQLSNDAQHALLKGLEDPPEHVYYILCTTDPQKLLPTIRGRCSQLEVKTLGEKVMVRLLHKIGSAEGSYVPFAQLLRWPT